MARIGPSIDTQRVIFSFLGCVDLCVLSLACKALQQSIVASLVAARELVFADSLAHTSADRELAMALTARHCGKLRAVSWQVKRFHTRKVSAWLECIIQRNQATLALVDIAIQTSYMDDMGVANRPLLTAKSIELLSRCPNLQTVDFSRGVDILYPRCLIPTDTVLRFCSMPHYPFSEVTPAAPYLREIASRMLHDFFSPFHHIFVSADCLTHLDLDGPLAAEITVLPKTLQRLCLSAQFPTEEHLRSLGRALAECRELTSLQIHSHSEVEHEAAHGSMDDVSLPSVTELDWTRATGHVWAPKLVKFTGSLTIGGLLHLMANSPQLQSLDAHTHTPHAKKIGATKWSAPFAEAVGATWCGSIAPWYRSGRIWQMRSSLPGRR